MKLAPTEKSDFGSHQTRRQFIRSVLIKTAYVAPIVATFTVANVSASSHNKSFSFMISSKMMMMQMMSPMGMGMGGSGSSGMMGGMGMLWS